MLTIFLVEIKVDKFYGLDLAKATARCANYKLKPSNDEIGEMSSKKFIFL